MQATRRALLEVSRDTRPLVATLARLEETIAKVPSAGDFAAIVRDVLVNASGPSVSATAPNNTTAAAASNSAAAAAADDLPAVLAELQGVDLPTIAQLGSFKGAWRLIESGARAWPPLKALFRVHVEKSRKRWFTLLGLKCRRQCQYLELLHKYVNEYVNKNLPHIANDSTKGPGAAAAIVIERLDRDRGAKTLTVALEHLSSKHSDPSKRRKRKAGSDD